mmetsp:Transcript_70653/g.132217  ORF Transcript_70653/g.132217 Transcript_70653/m.132217 type:complete len:151 (+) Transcript_70653:41-493(+)
MRSMRVSIVVFACFLHTLAAAQSDTAESAKPVAPAEAVAAEGQKTDAAAASSETAEKPANTTLDAVMDDLIEKDTLESWIPTDEQLQSKEERTAFVEKMKALVTRVVAQKHHIETLVALGQAWRARAANATATLETYSEFFAKHMKGEEL